MPAMAAADDPLFISMPFIRRSSIYAAEKAYGADVYTADIPCSNIRTQHISDIQLSDFRTLRNPPTFSKDGFGMAEFQTTLQEEDWTDQAKVESIYCREVGEFMKDYLGAKAVQIFEAQQVRRRHESFPRGLVDILIGYQPAMRPHIDASREHTIGKIKVLNGENAANMLQNKRWVYLNVWKPLKGPVRDWPLAFCDPKSVHGRDMLEVDNIVRGEVAENLVLHYDATQRWMYISDHMPTELLLMRQADSDGNTGVAHASFDLPLPPSSAAEPRESVEVRMIAYFDD